MSKFGKAKYRGEFKKRNFFKLKDGDSIFAIIPPIGDLAEDGVWSRFYSVHYGYRNSEGRMKVFSSPLVKNRKTRMIEVPDAALERIDLLKAELEKAKLENATVKIEKLKGLLKTYNMENRHYINVVDPQGNVGLLKICHRAKLSLDATIKRLRSEGVDPISVTDGRYFVFKRSGTSLDTTYQVDVLKQKMFIEGVGTVERDVVVRFDEATQARILDESADLDNLFKRVTAEDVERIVRDGAKAVDEIFASRPDSNEDIVDDMEEDVDSAVNTAASAPNSTTTTAQALPQQMAVPSQPVAAVVKPVPAPQIPVQTTAKAVETMSDEEYLASLGLT